jgi:hypothetical protein
VSCIDRSLAPAGVLCTAWLLAACAAQQSPAPVRAAQDSPVAAVSSAPSTRPAATVVTPAAPVVPGAPSQGASPTPKQGANPPERPGLAPAARARNWAEFHRIAALRMVAANRDGTYTGDVPEPLLAIPVLEIELNADGSIRRIQVTRQPTQATDTVQLAIEAVRRAAPFGDVSHLPKPWRWSEVFLFDDERRFKPRTLDL